MHSFDPTLLPGTPAPFWFVELFKGIGFFLHLIPMHLWFVGLPLAILALLVGGGSANRFARRMFGQLPIFLALGVNFAIVPLLFLQTTYYKAFYTATILTAWHWLAIIPLFLFAYYKIYACSFSIKRCLPEGGNGAVVGEKPKSPEKSGAAPTEKGKSVPAETASGKRTSGRKRTLFFGFLAWVFLVMIGVLITHGLNLMGRSEAWIGIWEKTNVGGAVTGLGNHFRDPFLWIRFAGMFGLALLTTAVWAVFDSRVLIPRSSDSKIEEKNRAYRKWTVSFAIRIAWIGVILTIGVFSYYLWMLEKIDDMGVLFGVPGLIFPLAVVLLPIVQAVLLTRLGQQSDKPGGKFTFISLLSGQVLLLGSFVVMRQLIQNVEVGRFIRVDRIPLADPFQWTPLVAFLALFVCGLLVILWIVRQLVLCSTTK